MKYALILRCQPRRPRFVVLASESVDLSSVCDNNLAELRMWLTKELRLRAMSFFKHSAPVSPPPPPGPCAEYRIRSLSAIALSRSSTYGYYCILESGSPFMRLY